MRLVQHIASSRIFFGTASLALGLVIGVAGMSAGLQCAPPVAPAAPAAFAGASMSTVVDTSTVAAVGDKTGRGGGLLRLLIGRTERAEITGATADGTRTILYVRGQIAALSASSITITLRDGTTQVFTIDATTTVRERGKPVKASDLATGDRAMAFGTRNADGTYTARLIRCVRQAAARPAG
jgi:uncharacterized protein DUF5666